MSGNISDDEVPVNVNYRKPEKKSVNEIIDADKGDESLNKYKQTLLGSAPSQVIVEPHNPNHVIIKSITLVADGRPEVTMDLSNPKAIESANFSVKEGAHYRLRFNFFVQREIVTGLKYFHKVSRHGITVDKETYMVGSYAPKTELQSYQTPLEEAPSGMMHRGKYKVKSKFVDDDGNCILEWTWTLEISKDW
ncbi:hypothetical protein WR25_05140 [Diploscapter pachys]|uniref:Rho GDP-dissociation inhibitor 3 n=1 Tax=Diploscapter pachys TaxID=2018661 RepID=A0A2A2JIK5_9BILA|nr:hypothetical protein WR25_05140 [Diploscapter pachys]